MTIKVQLGAARTIKKHFVEVRSLLEASEVVSKFIGNNDCTAGCGSDWNVFNGGDIFIDDEKAAHVSYNGRVWDLDQREVVLGFEKAYRKAEAINNLKCLQADGR